MHARNSELSSVASRVARNSMALLVLGFLTVVGGFIFIGGQYWITLVTLPVPIDSQNDFILGPPDNPGWRRTVNVSTSADKVLDFFITTLPEHGWTVEWETRDSEVTDVFCIKSTRLFFSTVYIEIINRLEGTKRLNESAVLIGTTTESTGCYNR